MKDANIYDGEKLEKPKEVKIFTENKYDDEPEKFITKSVEPKTLTIKELKKSVREIKSIGGDTRELLVEIGNRYSFPIFKFHNFFLRFISWKQICKRSFSNKYGTVCSFRLWVLYSTGFF